MKTKIKVIVSLLLILCISLGGTSTAFGYAHRTYDTSYWFYDNAHGYCNYITFTSTGDIDAGVVETMNWTSSYSHWPNGFTYGDKWSYTVGDTGYANGTFTAYSSLVTQWVSIAFQSYTQTITQVFEWNVAVPRNLYA